MRNFLRQDRLRQKSKNITLCSPLACIPTSALCLSVVLSLIANPHNVSAQVNNKPQWWFNVELIAFKRNLLPNNNEDFEQSEYAIDYTNSNQLLYLSAIQRSATLRSLREGLAICNASDLVNNRYRVNVGFGTLASSEYAANVAKMSPRYNDAYRDANATSSQSIDNTFAFSYDLLKQLLAPIDIPPIEDANADISKQAQTFTQNSPRSPLQNERTNRERVTDLPRLNAEFSVPQENLQQDNLIKIDDLQSRLKQMQRQLTRITETPIKVSCVANENVGELKGLTIVSQHSLKIIDDLSDERLNQIPLMLFNPRETFTGNSQLIAESELYLHDYAEKVFAQADIQALIYTAWRQEVVFGAENAEFYRVRAGKRLESKQEQQYELYNKLYEQTHTSLQTIGQDSFFEELKNSIDSNQAVDWLAQEDAIESLDNTSIPLKTEFELDGLFKVYLDYVNQVPYLHVDTEFKHYRLNIDETGNAKIASYPSKQRRRIISKQIHYFDHPAFGIIVRLERYKVPVANVGDSNNE